MKYFILKAFAATILSAGLFLPNQVEAVPISGDVSFVGTVALNEAIPTATSIVSFSNVAVSQNTQTGDYVGTDGEVTTMTPFQFLPVLSPNPVNPVWTFLSGGLTYSFRLESVGVDKPFFNGQQFLILSGTGFANITGPGSDFDETFGTWSLTTQGEKSTLSFSSTSSVPDGGATIALLGLTLLGIGCIHQKLGSASLLKA